jgi:hypothetical protein
MSEKFGTYTVVDLPAARRDTPNFLDLIHVKHSMYGLIEVDVTVTRQFIEAHKARTGEALSFTGYMAFCLAHAVDETKSVQMYLKGRKQLVMFNDVDVGMTIERRIGGTRAPMGYVIRRANNKTFKEIHQEIRSVQSQPVPPSKGMPDWVRFILLLPWPLPTLFITLLRSIRRWDPAGPAGIVPTGGTVAVTAVGMFGRSNGWGITPTAHSLMLIVGGISRKPAMVDDRIEPREILNLTVVFDHDVVDGAVAARFVQRLVDLIESGSGLAETNQVAVSSVESGASKVRGAITS